VLVCELKAEVASATTHGNAHDKTKGYDEAKTLTKFIRKVCSKHSKQQTAKKDTRFRF